MTQFAYLILAIAAFPQALYADECSLPTGKVDHIDLRLNKGDMPQFEFSDRIAPGDDCKSIKVWTYRSSDESSLKSPPSNSNCSRAGTRDAGLPDVGLPEGLASCTHFRVYNDENKAEGKPLPHAYVKDGVLIAKQTLLSGDAVTSFYIINRPGTSDRVFVQTKMSNTVPSTGNTPFGGGFGMPIGGGEYPGKAPNNPMIYQGSKKVNPPSPQQGSGSGSGSTGPQSSGSGK